MILAVAGVAFTPQPAMAACSSLFTFNFGVCATEFTAWMGNIITTAVGFILSLTGILLSFSIKLTLNIRDIYDGTPAIKSVWVVIRNISSMLIIFMLLYSSIETILGIGGSNLKKLVGNIIIAGLLINFSLFFTKVLIDGSNLISLQFYRAIAPDALSQPTKGWASSFNDGGLSNVFMASLKIQKVYHPDTADIKNIGSKGEGTVWIAMIISIYGGVVLMLFASISFLAAAVAFSIRTGMLLLLMAFSPIYFVGMIFPKIKSEVSDVWLKYLTQQLLFMPIYLLLMYVALKIISDDGFLSFIQEGSLSNIDSKMVLAGVIIQYVIAILFINAPLIAAIKFGAIGTKFADNMTKGLKDRIYNSPKNVGSFASFAGQHLIGGYAKNLQGAVASSGWAAKNPNLAIMANKTFGKVASSTFGGTKGGYDKRFKDYSKAREDFLNKGIKLNDNEKQVAITSGLSSWDDETESLNKNIAAAEKLAENKTMSDEARSKAKRRLVELQSEDKARKAAETAGSKDKYLEGKMLKEKKEEYAENLEKQTKLGFFTNKARKEAAESFRKEANKSEEKKLLEMLQKMKKDADKEESPDKDKPKEEKPKP